MATQCDVILRWSATPDRQATIDSRRRQIPAEGIEDVGVDGTSWNLSN